VGLLLPLCLPRGAPLTYVRPRRPNLVLRQFLPSLFTSCLAVLLPAAPLQKGPAAKGVGRGNVNPSNHTPTPSNIASSLFKFKEDRRGQALPATSSLSYIYHTTHTALSTRPLKAPRTQYPPARAARTYKGFMKRVLFGGAAA
jgi:hypothetical protein